MTDTLFTKIVNKELPADIIFQDDEVTAFRDINPIAPEHILIIPNKPIPTINDAQTEDQMVLGKLFLVAADIAKQLQIDENGYRLIMNCNRDGGQEIYHIHMHLVGGKPLGPMLSKK